MAVALPWPMSGIAGQGGRTKWRGLIDRADGSPLVSLFPQLPHEDGVGLGEPWAPSDSKVAEVSESLRSASRVQPTRAPLGFGWGMGSGGCLPCPFHV